MWKIKHIAILVILTSVFTSRLCALEPATSTPTISVRPARSVLYIKPGKSYKGVFYVENKSSDLVDVKCTPVDWTHLAQGPTDGSAPAWLQIKQNSQKIGPNKESPFSYSLQVPKETTGEIIAQVFFEPSYVKKESGMLHTRNGVILIVIAKGTEKIGLENITAELEQNNTSKDVKFFLNLTNTGNVHLQWNSDIQVLNEKNEVLAKTFLKSPQSILPGKNHRISSIVENFPAASGPFHAKVSLHYGIEDAQEQFKSLDIPIKEITPELK